MTSKPLEYPAWLRALFTWGLGPCQVDNVNNVTMMGAQGQQSQFELGRGWGQRTYG